MNTRKIVVKALQMTGLNRLAHKLYYNYVHGFDTANQAVLDAQERCFNKALELGTARGSDYMEFGLFKGYSFWHAQKVARDLDLETTRFFGFDSFAGLPDVQGIDRTASDDFYAGQYACSKEQVTKNLDSKGIDWDRTFLIEGYYDASLTDDVKQKYALHSVSIALIDCDLYESTRDVLNFLEDLIADNTILMMDDWNCFNADDSKGQRRALAEFLEKNKRWSVEDFFSYGTWGHVFIVHEVTN